MCNACSVEYKLIKKVSCELIIKKGFMMLCPRMCV